MPEKNKLDKLQARSRKAKEKASSLWSKVWPINPELYKNPSDVVKAITKGSRFAQSFFALGVIGIIVSIVMIGTGIYGMFSQEVLSGGGYVKEAVISNQLEVFNPVLELQSPAEIKVSNLLFHPLYSVEYPNFLENPSETATITPILLEQEPTWLDENETDEQNRFKTLQFILKEDLKWSNDQPITVKDVRYSFDRIKEARGNSRFREIFKNLNFKQINDREFHLISEISNPQLKFTTGFRPISSSYYVNQNTDRLFADPKSSLVKVTSGYYKVGDSELDDPTTSDVDNIENPLRNERSKNIEQIILTKNSVNNYKEPAIENYIIQKLSGVFDNPGVDNDSNLEFQSNEGNIDLYTRSLGTNLNLPTSQLTSEIDLETKIVPTNTFYSLYLNIRSGDYFINSGLRKYVMCKLLDFTPNPVYDGMIDQLPRNKQLIPLQLGAEVEPECEGNLDDIILQNETRAYSFVDGDDGNREIRVYNSKPILTMVGLAESEPLLSDIKNYFKQEIGLELEIIRDKSEVQKALDDKSYNIAFLPVTYISRDLNPIYGASGRDLSEIRRNRLVNPDEFEAALQAYSLSNYTDDGARQQLIDFFATNNVSITMFQNNAEYNYSERVIGLGDSLPDLHIFEDNVYKGLPDWFANTKREIK